MIMTKSGLLFQKNSLTQTTHGQPQNITTTPATQITKKDELPPECTAKGVNRHNDILPNPKTRVVLEQLNNDANTTYMNANYIHGVDGTAKKYIASMG